MRAILRVMTMSLALQGMAALAGSPPRLADLPPPVRAYAEALKPYCEVFGKHEVVVNGIYTDRLFGEIDVNHDGRRDYIIYKCMFGCEGDPYALQGLGPNCMFGSLLLSASGDYKSVPIPGQLSQFETEPLVRVAVYRAHIHKQDCGGDWYCNYVYELRDDWFRVVDVCPQSGCRAVLAELKRKDELQAAESVATPD